MLKPSNLQLEFQAETLVRTVNRSLARTVTNRCMLIFRPAPITLAHGKPEEMTVTDSLAETITHWSDGVCVTSVYLVLSQETPPTHTSNAGALF